MVVASRLMAWGVTGLEVSDMGWKGIEWNNPGLVIFGIPYLAFLFLVWLWTWPLIRGLLWLLGLR